MPRIPDNRQLSRVNPSQQAPVARLDTSNVGAASEIAAETVRDVLDARSEYQLSKAESQFLTYKEEQDRRFREDDDYQTFDSRYTQGMSEGLSEIAGTIDDPLARQAFMERQRPVIERGRTRIQDMAWAKESDAERRSINEQLEQLRNDAIENGEFDLFVDRATNLVNSAADIGYIDQETAGNTLAQWTDNTASGYIQSLDPQSQLETLQDPDGPAQNLPADTRARMLREAQSANAAREAIGIVDRMQADGFGLESMMQETRTIEDPVLRTEVERRFITQHGRNEQAKTEGRANFHNEFYLEVRRGNISMDEVPKDALQNANFTSSQLESLYTAENLSANDISFSDQTVVDQLREYERNGNRRDATEYLMANASKLSIEDYELWRNAVTPGQEPSPEVQGMLSAQGEVKNAATAAGIDDDITVGRLTKGMSEWFQDYQRRNNGNTPSAKEIQDQVDFRMMEVTEPGGGFLWFDREVPLMDHSAVQEGVIDMMSLSRLRDSFIRVENREPTMQELMDLIPDADNQ